MRFLFFALIVLLSSGVAADDYLPVDRQIQIIVNYQRVTGQVKDIPSWALDVADPEPDVIKCGSPAVLTFLDNYDRLDPAMLKAMGVQLWVRPDLPLYYDTPSGIFRIHYATEGIDAVYLPNDDGNSNGVPDYVDSVAAIADHVYSHIRDTLGCPEFPRDGYEQGGDERYDIYLSALQSNFYGLSYADSLMLDDDGSTYIATSFMKLRTEYGSISGYQSRPYEALQVTIAHEMFHAFQYGMDRFEIGAQVDGDGSVLDRPSWMEMSAVWMEDEIYDDVNDYRYYLEYFFSNPGESIEQFLPTKPYHPYASVVWPLFLSQKFGSEIIRDIWVLCGDLGSGPDFKEATQLAIDSISGGTENFATVFSEFALACYFIGDRYDYLPVEVHKVRHWLCSDGDFPNCLDSELVTELPDSLGKTTIDTVMFTGFEEGNHYDDWYWVRDSNNIEVEEDPLHHYSYYPVFVPGHTNSHSPEINALYYMTFLDLDRVPVDTTYWTCDEWPAQCIDSNEVIDTTQGYDFRHEDSSFTCHILLGDGPQGHGGVVPTLSQGWGVNTIFQLEENPDSVFVRNEISPDDKGAPYPTENPDDYRSICYAMSAAAPDSGLYERSVYRQQEIAYGVGDSTLIDSARIRLPAAVLSPYPNPAVIAEMSGEPVKFKIQVTTDENSTPMFDNPYLVVDVFTLAGERVVTIDDEVATYSCGRHHLGVFCVDWDMKNESGADVASGVYIAYARLYSLAKRGTLLAEAFEKVAVIR